MILMLPILVKITFIPFKYEGKNIILRLAKPKGCMVNVTSLNFLNGIFIF